MHEHALWEAVCLAGVPGFRIIGMWRYFLSFILEVQHFEFQIITNSRLVVKVYRNPRWFVICGCRPETSRVAPHVAMQCLLWTTTVKPRSIWTKTEVRSAESDGKLFFARSVASLSPEYRSAE